MILDTFWTFLVGRFEVTRDNFHSSVDDVAIGSWDERNIEFFILVKVGEIGEYSSSESSVDKCFHRSGYQNAPRARLTFTLCPWSSWRGSVLRFIACVSASIVRVSNKIQFGNQNR